MSLADAGISSPPGLTSVPDYESFSDNEEKMPLMREPSSMPYGSSNWASGTALRERAETFATRTRAMSDAFQWGRGAPSRDRHQSMDETDFVLRVSRGDSRHVSETDTPVVYGRHSLHHGRQSLHHGRQSFHESRLSPGMNARDSPTSRRSFAPSEQRVSRSKGNSGPWGSNMLEVPLPPRSRAASGVCVISALPPPPDIHPPPWSSGFPPLEYDPSFSSPFTPNVPQPIDFGFYTGPPNSTHLGPTYSFQHGQPMSCDLSPTPTDNMNDFFTPMNGGLQTIHDVAWTMDEMDGSSPMHHNYAVTPQNSFFPADNGMMTPYSHLDVTFGKVPVWGFTGAESTHANDNSPNTPIGSDYTPQNISGGRASGADGKPTQPQVDSEVATTVMIRNVPNKYTRQMLVDQLHKNGFGEKFDFLYLPIDFKNSCNVGYGFLNFRTVEETKMFIERFHGKSAMDCLPGFNSRKVVNVGYARMQGLEPNVARLKNSPVMGKLKSSADFYEWLPLLLDQNGEEKEWPAPDKVYEQRVNEGKLTVRPGGQFDEERRQNNFPHVKGSKPLIKGKGKGKAKNKSDTFGDGNHMRMYSVDTYGGPMTQNDSSTQVDSINDNSASSTMGLSATEGWSSFRKTENSSVEKSGGKPGKFRFDGKPAKGTGFYQNFSKSSN